MNPKIRKFLSFDISSVSIICFFLLMFYIKRFVEFIPLFPGYNQFVYPFNLLQILKGNSVYVLSDSLIIPVLSMISIIIPPITIFLVFLWLFLWCRSKANKEFNGKFTICTILILVFSLLSYSTSLFCEYQGNIYGEALRSVGEKESVKTDSGFLLIDTHKHFSEVIKAIKEKSGNRNSEVFYSIEDKKFILVPSVEIERLKLDVKILKRDSK